MTTVLNCPTSVTKGQTPRYGAGGFAFVDTFDSHHWDGIALAVPFTIIYSMLLRRYAVDGLFGSMPDFGPLRARSYRVLANGRPRLLVTAFSAFIGVASHIAIDSFTHPYRIGSNLLGLHRVPQAPEDVRLPSWAWHCSPECCGGSRTHSSPSSTWDLPPCSRSC